MPHGQPSKSAAKWSNLASSRRKRMRKVIEARDGINCFHCGKQTEYPTGGNVNNLAEMTIDHFPVPKRDLPVWQWLDPSRAVIACLECNRKLDNQYQTGGKK